MLTRFFTISSRTLAFLEKLKTVFDSWLAPLALLLLGITYFFIVDRVFLKRRAKIKQTTTYFSNKSSLKP